MPKPSFRVKRYAHDKYKFLVRGKVEGRWKRRYFVTESEAIAFAEEQNAAAEQKNPLRSPNGAEEMAALIPERHPRLQLSSWARDLADLVAPTFLGPRIERYLGDSWCMHLPFAYDLMRELAPKVFVELGVKQGESYFAFCQSAVENKISVRCYGVDSWRGDIQTGPLDPEIEHEVVEYNWRYSSFSELKSMFFAEALGDFADGSIDLLHIDGTHVYADVKADFESWLPKLSANGVILFHDVVLRDRGFGVWKVWEEIIGEQNSFLFEFGYGLGVWKKQPVTADDPPFVRRLMSANEVERREISYFYANAAAALALWESLQKQPDSAGEVSRLEQKIDESAGQIQNLQSDAEEKARHIALLQRENEESTKQVAHFQGDAEEKARHIALLQRENEESTKQVAHFHREADNKRHEIGRLQDQLMMQTEAARRAADDALDARWEALSLRKGTVTRSDSLQALSARVVELQSEVETLSNERQHSREAAGRLLTELTENRIKVEDLERQLHAAREEVNRVQQERETAEKRLTKFRKHLDRLDGLTSQKFILPFGRRQRGLRETIDSAAQI